MPESNPHSNAPAKPARHRRKKKAKGGHEAMHVDEKWLVSYSDMMTLLFGLFVMLYSIAMKNKGSKESMEQALAQISKSGFKAVADKSRSPDSVTENTFKTVTDAVVANQKLKDLTEKIMEMELEKKEQEQKLKETEEQLAVAAEDNENLEAEMAKLNQEFQTTQKAVAKSDKKLSNLKSEKEQLMKSAEDLKATQNQMEKTESELKQAQESLEKSEEKIKDLERKLASAQASANAKPVLLMARWEDEKFDIDFEIVDPAKKIINFKNKTRPGSKAMFLADANKGPGQEIVQIDSQSNGDYSANLKIYNSRGQSKPVKVSLFLAGDQGEVNLGTVELNNASQRSIKIPLKIGKDGAISAILPSAPAAENKPEVSK